MTRGAGRKDRASSFGSVDRLATGWRARYFGPDGHRHKAPVIFRTKSQARSWLSLQQADILRKTWRPSEPAEGPTLACYADQWLPARLVAGRPLKTRTRAHYRRLLDDHILPCLGDRPVGSITAEEVRRWHEGTLTQRPTMRAHAYSLLRTIMASAVGEGLATLNPCAIRGAGSTTRVHTVRTATMQELAIIVETMPARYRALVLLATWCALRYGELTELRRADIDLGQEVIKVRRGVVRTKGGFETTTPKSLAGVREVAIPPHLVGVVEHHLGAHVGAGPDALVFPAQDRQRHLAPSTLSRHWYRARAAAGREDLRLHDLRHTGAVLAAVAGGTLPELMNRLGHSTPAAALRYQHVAAGRDKEIAALMSKLANGS